jgi:hypothetical protein
MAQDLELRSHPRLFVGPEQIANVKNPPTLTWLQGVDRWTRKMADEWIDLPPYTEPNYNEFQFRMGYGRQHQMRVFSLAVRWMQSGEERYREGVLNYIRQMDTWDAWSEAYHNNNVIEEGTVFDLNHGERATTMALAYDWLYDSLSEAEKATFLTIASKHLFKPALDQCHEGKAWWYAMAHNNWNGVCAGGLGLLCLAFYDESEEARELLTRVEYSLDIFMRAHADNDGASEEGTGYWNFGMRYAGLYLRSHEEATGKRHPLLEEPWLENSLTFPLDFSPHGMDVGFGDIPGFGQPLPFHYDIARSRGLNAVLGRIDARLQWHDDPVPSTNTGTGLNYRDSMEGATSVWLLVHDGVSAPAPTVQTDVVKLYPGLDWALLADSMPHPERYMSVRGGNAGVAHAQADLLSFNCCVGKEILIGNPKPCKYLPTTFTRRRGHIPDISPQFKNTLIINGVGIYHDTTTDSVEAVEGDGFKGVRMVATSAFTTPKGSARPRNMSQLDFVGRLFLMLDNASWLIVDSMSSPKGGPALCEARFHTYANAELSDQGALIRGSQESLRISFAANTEAVLTTTQTTPTTHRDKPATMLRWCKDDILTEKAPRTTIFATLLTPGSAAAAVDVVQNGNTIDVQVTTAGQTRTLTFRTDLSAAALSSSGVKI